jgi:energy-converting hydrogenase Eha subunit E
MIALMWIGWGAIAMGALGAIVALGEEDVFLLSAALSLVVSGVVFLALDRVVRLLTDIRDSVRPATTAVPEVDPEIEADHPLGFQPRTPQELQLAIDKMRGSQ